MLNKIRRLLTAKLIELCVYAATVYLMGFIDPSINVPVNFAPTINVTTIIVEAPPVPPVSGDGGEPQR